MSRACLGSVTMIFTACWILLQVVTSVLSAPTAGNNLGCCVRRVPPPSETQELSEQADIPTFMAEYPALTGWGTPPRRGHVPIPVLEDPPRREIHRSIGAATLGTNFLEFIMVWEASDPTVFQVQVNQLLGPAANSTGMISAVSAHEQSFHPRNRSVRSIDVEWQLMRVAGPPVRGIPNPVRPFTEWDPMACEILKLRPSPGSGVLPNMGLSIR